MSDDENTIAESEWVLYKDNPEWDDVKPVYQNDGPNSIVQIAYSENFKDTYDYMRAILKSEEKSERALKLTTSALYLNPANYTVWQYRRDIIRHLHLDSREELEYSRNVIMTHPKNYQVWHHRREIVVYSGNFAQELEVTEQALSMDPKNYHAWQHRQWAIKEYNLYHEELAFTDELIEQDLRNNSAWNQRFFIIKEFYGFTPERVAQEVAYAIKRMEHVKNNESAWNYVRGVLEKDKGIHTNLNIEHFCEKAYGSGYKGVHLVMFLFDVYNQRFLNNKNDADSSNKALKLVDELKSIIDPIRKNYWEYMELNILRELSTADQPGAEQQT